MLKEFKAFILRGNVVDLAVGVVIGAAFGMIVNSLVNNVITPLISLLNIPDFSRATLELGDPGPAGDMRYGLVINALISFFVIGLVIFFFVVRPVNHLTGRGKEDPKMHDCPHCLSSIPVGAKVCPNCTRDVTSARSSGRRGASARR